LERPKAGPGGSRENQSRRPRRQPPGKHPPRRPPRASEGAVPARAGARAEARARAGARERPRGGRGPRAAPRRPAAARAGARRAARAARRSPRSRLRRSLPEATPKRRGHPRCARRDALCAPGRQRGVFARRARRRRASASSASRRTPERAPWRCPCGTRARGARANAAATQPAWLALTQREIRLATRHRVGGCPYVSAHVAHTRVTGADFAFVYDCLRTESDPKISRPKTRADNHRPLGVFSAEHLVFRERRVEVVERQPPLVARTPARAHARAVEDVRVNGAPASRGRRESTTQRTHEHEGASTRSSRARPTPRWAPRCQDLGQADERWPGADRGRARRRRAERRETVRGSARSRSEGRHGAFRATRARSPPSAHPRARPKRASPRLRTAAAGARETRA